MTGCVLRAVPWPLLLASCAIVIGPFEPQKIWWVATLGAVANPLANPSRAKDPHPTFPRIQLNATRADKILEFHQDE